MAISGIGGGFSNLNLTTSAQERAQKLVKQLDADSDGKVSKQEFATPALRSANDLFAKADSDGDGSLSVEDLSAMLAKHETHATARGAHQKGDLGGVGSPPPGGPGRPPPGGAAGGAGGGPTGSAASSSSTDFDPADTDHDGTVSSAEKLAFQLSQQGVSDTNGT